MGLTLEPNVLKYKREAYGPPFLRFDILLFIQKRFSSRRVGFSDDLLAYRW
ncbi:MAG: hypothetical protein RL440_1831 [Bacteroidota bacterium]